MALSAKQIALIAVARTALHLREEDYRAILANIAGIEHTRELDRLGFDLLMQEFRRLGFESDSHKANLGTRPGMATPGQISLIRNLWAEFTGGEGTDASLGKWLDGKFKVSSLRFLPKARASKVIQALRAMVAMRSAA